MNKAIFLDRDGTIVLDNGYVHKIEDFHLIPNVLEGLRILQDADYKLIIITNQAGIGRGYYTKKDYFIFREYLHNYLKKNKISITEEYFCPHKPDDDCDCRKPKTGLLEKAVRRFNLNLNECWMIGDSEKDIEVGKNLGCKTIHVLTGHVKNPIKEADFVAKDLLEAAKFILRNKNK